MPIAKYTPATHSYQSRRMKGDETTNIAMQEAIARGECIDLKDAPKMGFDYILDTFVEDMDYCDTTLNTWIWSIGRRRSDGLILASINGKFFTTIGFECIFLR